MMLSEPLRKRLWFIYFAVLLTWSLNAYILLGNLLQNHELFAVKVANHPYVSDFINVYGAGVLARRCLERPTDIYDANAQIELQQSLIAPVQMEQPFYNQYPPLMFLFFLPLSFFDMATAWCVWCLTSMAVMAVTLKLTLMHEFKTKFTKCFAFVAFMTAYPTWFSFRLGQTSLLLFPAMLAYWYLLMGKRFVLAGIVASVLIIKLQYIPIIVAVGVAVGGLRFLSGFAASAAVLLGISTAVVGWDNMMRFPHALLSHESSTKVSGVSADMMQNLRGLLVLMLGSDSHLVHVITGIAAIVTAFVIFIAWRKIDTTHPVKFKLLAAITTMAALIFSPHTHIQDYIIALIPCAWVVQIAKMEYTGIGAKATGAALKGALGFPLVSWFFFLLLFAFHLIKMQPFALWGIGLATSCAWQLKEAHRMRPNFIDEEDEKDIATALDAVETDTKNGKAQ